MTASELQFGALEHSQQGFQKINIFIYFNNSRYNKPNI